MRRLCGLDIHRVSQLLQAPGSTDIRAQPEDQTSRPIAAREAHCSSFVAISWHVSDNADWQRCGRLDNRKPSGPERSSAATLSITPRRFRERSWPSSFACPSCRAGVASSDSSRPIRLTAAMQFCSAVLPFAQRFGASGMLWVR